MKELIGKVVDWAKNRNLIDGSDVKTQALKLMSEVGEMADNLIKGKNVKDDIGDCLVVLIVIAEKEGLTLEDCLQLAYDEIKNRKGVLLDGVFIKESDAAYEGALNVLAARRVHNA